MAKARKSGNGSLRLYRSYMFKDKDPVIDELRTCVEDSKLSYTAIRNKSDVSTTTMRSWFMGKTRCPQFRTVAAVTSALGATLTVKSGKVTVK